MEDIPDPIVFPKDEIARLAQRYRRANGPVMALVNRLGGGLEGQVALLPVPVRERLERMAALGLSGAYSVAAAGGRAPDLGPQGPLMAAMASGAVGGAGGIATSIAEMPVTITVILHAIRAAAVEAGFDPEDPLIRKHCLEVFGSGGPLAADDGVNTSFLSARLTLNGTTVSQIIARVAPQLAVVLGQRLAASMVPVIGAVTGAALNASFLSYYREVARIRFALLRLTEVHGEGQVLDAFRVAAEMRPVTKV